MFNAYAAMDAGQPLEPYQYDPGELAPNHVEIEVENCGLCHSDLSMIDNEWGLSSYPLIGGHEVIGLVRDKGSDVTHLNNGDRVRTGLVQRLLSPLSRL